VLVTECVACKGVDNYVDRGLEVEKPLRYPTDGCGSSECRPADLKDGIGRCPVHEHERWQDDGDHPNLHGFNTQIEGKNPSNSIPM
jgi:hypothetical protein